MPISLEPILAVAYYNRGNAYAKQQNMPAALADFSKAIQLDPSLAAAYYNRGNAYARRKDYPAALADYSKAIELQPTLAAAYYNRGNGHTQLKDYPAALADYARAIELDPGDAAPAYNMACTYALQNNTEQACHWLRHSIDLDEKYVAMSWTDSDFDAIRDTSEFRTLLRAFAGPDLPP